MDPCRRLGPLLVGKLRQPLRRHAVLFERGGDPLPDGEGVHGHGLAGQEFQVHTRHGRFAPVALHAILFEGRCSVGSRFVGAPHGSANYQSGQGGRPQEKHNSTAAHTRRLNSGRQGSHSY